MRAGLTGVSTDEAYRCSRQGRRQRRDPWRSAARAGPCSNCWAAPRSPPPEQSASTSPWSASETTTESRHSRRSVYSSQPSVWTLGLNRSLLPLENLIITSRSGAILLSINTTILKQLSNVFFCPFNLYFPLVWNHFRCTSLNLFFCGVTVFWVTKLFYSIRMHSNRMRTALSMTV